MSSTSHAAADSTMITSSCSAKMNQKNTIQTPWTLYSKLFGPQAFSPVSGMTLNDKVEIYFQDHSIMPLFVQENYLRGKFQRAGGEVGPGLQLKNLELACKAAESVSDGDLVDAMIHGYVHALSVRPTQAAKCFD